MIKILIFGDQLFVYLQHKVPTGTMKHLIKQLLYMSTDVLKIFSLPL